MSGVGDLIGRHWHEWPCIGDIENTTPSSGGSLQSSCDVSPSSSRMSTPPPRCTNLDNVMKLPKRDMHVFGHCPAQDEIVVGVCDSCGLMVKIEALGSHVRLRHGLPMSIDSSSDSLNSIRSDFSSLMEPHQPNICNVATKLKTGSSSGALITSNPMSHSESPTPEATEDKIFIDVAKPLKSTKRKKKRKFQTKIFLEYSPDSHCGVWNHVGSRQCTRSLTCKTHSITLKRKISGRSRPFDELLKAFKKGQTAPDIEETSSSQIEEATEIPGKPFSPNTKQVGLQNSVQLNSVKPSKSGLDPFESFSFTNDHPKPLAVCSFSATRFGGFVWCGRNQGLTAKLVKLSLMKGSIGSLESSSLFRTSIPRACGFQRIAPQSTAVKGSSPCQSFSSPVGVINQSFLIKCNKVSKKPCTDTPKPLSPLVNSTKFQNSFRTDIQDFKGGIKFELGSRIQLAQFANNEEKG